MNSCRHYLANKSKEFAKNVILLCNKLSVKKNSYALTSQLIRCGTSIGANIREAQYAQSKADFISKLEIALKEANETEYWLELMAETGHIEENDYTALKNECGQIRRMLISSCKTVKESRH